MYFRNRTEAGRLLAKALRKYKGKDVVVYALPRGGVVVAVEVARELHAPLDLIIPRKIGHPYHPEYAIAAIAENGYIAGEQKELKSVDEKWLREEIERQRKEAKRRREKYLQGKAEIPVEGKIAVLVDDGVATGLTMRVGIMELKHRHPKKIVVAVPVVTEKIAALLKEEAGGVVEVVALDTLSDDAFLGSVGAYYDEFYQVEDEEVVSILKGYENEFQMLNVKFQMSKL
ncbi:phosphoribosyl transferase [Patescibacteria group bacterium]|nr:phosphoribosyl transferase [Patescibacteria group bacterium]